MDVEYQRCLIAADFAKLQQRIVDEQRDIQVEFADGAIFARMYGPAGRDEPYLLKVEPGLYPVNQWRVGFIDPAVETERRKLIPDRDPRFWPLSTIAGLFGGFHLNFAGPYRVFVCLPFTTEFFYYHPERRWEPEVYDLARVVIEVEKQVKKAVHFSKWYPVISRGEQL